MIYPFKRHEVSEESTIVSVRDRLLKNRNALLDLSTRNRLLNVPLRTRNVRTIEIVDEKSSEIYRLLADNKAFSFVPGRQLTDEEKAELAEGDTETGGIPQPEDEEADERGVSKRHSDLRLQTKLTSEGLQKRLFEVWYDARTLEEEQGVNILYLGLGLLRWYDADASDVARHAPLVLLPVQLERTSAAEKFKLRWRGEPASPNLSLQAKMKAEFNIVIEEFADEDELDLGAYFAKIALSVSSQKRWEVLPDAMVLGFFSFAKFLMYRDLDPENWPKDGPIDENPLIVGLLRDGFPEDDPVIPNDSCPIDPIITPKATNHVVDADSSQTVVIEEAAQGRTMVVKGPPGTGKSQTITNIIAAAAAQGKRILFVAEKMAALDVVHRRLKDCGLGALTLELHSNKANKRAVLDELKRTKELQIRSKKLDASLVDDLERVRDELNGHASRLHERLQPYELSAFHVLGQIIRLRDRDDVEVPALDGPETWTQSGFRERLDLTREIGERLALIGNPTVHPWRGVQASAFDPTELAALARDIETLRTLLDDVCAALETAARILATALPEKLSGLAGAESELAAAVAYPEGNRASLAHAAWWSEERKVLDLPELGEAFVARRSEVDAAFQPIAWDIDPLPIRTALVTKGQSFLRFLDGNYRAQIALLRSYLKSPLPKDYAARLALVDQLLSAQAARREYLAAASAGPAYGDLWREDQSDWSRMKAVADWRKSAASASLGRDFLERLAVVEDMASLREAAATLKRSSANLASGWQKIVATLSLDLRRAFRVAAADDIAIAALRDRLADWSQHREGITRWVAFFERARKASQLGMSKLIEGILDGDIDGPAVSLAFERAYFEALRIDVFQRLPELKAFDGELQDRTVRKFQELDLARIELARQEIAHQHWEGLPRGGGAIGPLGVLNGELAKKRRLLPIRQLLEKAGPAIQQMKPIFMMSPLSVAQFLKPGSLQFDVLVMDEASQIEPVDALGAIARAKQIVVVGDERQLPPTRFFAKLTGDHDDDEESEEYQLQASTVESVLDLCIAKGVPHRMLNWHYRSKHQSLIAVSNREFYENRLFIVPSPYDVAAGMGLKFNHLPHAHYDRGNTRTNPIEAKTVADAVIQHARHSPAQTLGVATFSTAQRQAILKELELLRRANPDTEEFFSRGGSEPFFVKNLENIQGDERDVIFISVGYGKTETGYMAMSFGPLNGEGGERRLNVLISRAKLRCEVFSSITGDDIDLERARSRGVAALKLFLTFAQTGKLGVAEETGRDPDSVFEEEVAARLRSLGYDVRTQVGVAGFFVDLAIADPKKPGRYVLGIECDGAQYHSSRSARDRDRLRQSVLESHRWIIHRIWSTDWYLRPEEELKKVTTAIDAAIAEWRERDEGGFKSPAVPLQFSVREEEEADIIVGHIGEPAVEHLLLSEPYVEAEFSVDSRGDLHLVPLYRLAELVGRVVEVEGPIHQDEIVARLRILWGLGRAGGRIRSAVQGAVKLAQQRGLIAGGPTFFEKPDGVVTVRDRSQVRSGSLRRPEVIPPREVSAAVRKIVAQNYGAEREQLVIAVSRALGFAATSMQLRAVILSEIERMVSCEELAEQGGLLLVAQPVPAE